MSDKSKTCVTDDLAVGEGQIRDNAVQNELVFEAEPREQENIDDG